LADQTNAERERDTRGMLRWARRQFAGYRKGLQALRSHPDAGEALEKQIQLFTLIEDECRTDRPENRARSDCRALALIQERFSGGRVPVRGIRSYRDRALG
jgi:hypothetical protein